jgi:hypothetical protein
MVDPSSLELFRSNLLRVARGYGSPLFLEGHLLVEPVMGRFLEGEED